MNRICSACKEEKSLGEFSWKKRNKTYQSTCKDCTRKRANKHYKENQEVYCEGRDQRKQEIRLFMHEYYSSHPCVDCGEDDPIVLQCDHVGKKTINLSRVAHYGWSNARILAELAECEVRCANCHARETAKNQGWYSNLPLVV